MQYSRSVTVIAADADVVVKVSGTDTLIQVNEGVYEFIMPETDVEIEVKEIFGDKVYLSEKRSLQ